MKKKQRINYTCYDKKTGYECNGYIEPTALKKVMQRFNQLPKLEIKLVADTKVLAKAMK